MTKEDIAFLLREASSHILSLCARDPDAITEKVFADQLREAADLVERAPDPTPAQLYARLKEAQEAVEEMEAARDAELPDDESTLPGAPGDTDSEAA